MRRKQVIITMGDPAGSGPESVIFSLSNPALRSSLNKVSYILIGAKKIFSKVKGAQGILKKVELIDLDNVDLKRWKWGKIDRDSGKASREYIDTAMALLRTYPGASLVTAPVSKEAISVSGIRFSGHTEYLAKNTGGKDVIMLFRGVNFTLSLITRHIPLKKVSVALQNRELIRKTLRLTYAACKKLFKLKNPRIGICSFNPHAGIAGAMFKEEEALKQAADSLFCRKNLRGPFPADSIFLKALRKELDAVVSCYHDQAMIPFKLFDFDDGMNITYGLPFLRVSPVYGTARDIAGTGKLNYSSMIAAIKFAARHVFQTEQRS